MEGLNYTPKKEGYTNERREDFRERNFPRVIAQHLIEHVTDDLADAGFEEDKIQEFERSLAELNEHTLQAFLSVPAQLRVRLYETYLEKVQDGKLTIEEMVEDIGKKNQSNHFTLGYHLSPREIAPDKEGNWTIRGTEPDHRNEDIPMAYYSLDYRNRYREKPSRYLYVVRAELRDQSGHYQDNNGVWGRAPSLSVIDRFDMSTLEQEMDQLTSETEGKKE